MALLCHNLRPTDLVWWLIWYSSFTQWWTTSRSKKTSARTHINLQDGLPFLLSLWLRVRVKVTVRTLCLFLNIEMQYIFSINNCGIYWIFIIVVVLKINCLPIFPHNSVSAICLLYTELTNEIHSCCFVGSFKLYNLINTLIRYYRIRFGKDHKQTAPGCGDLYICLKRLTILTASLFILTVCLQVHYTPANSDFWQKRVFTRYWFYNNDRWVNMFHKEKNIVVVVIMIMIIRRTMLMKELICG